MLCCSMLVTAASSMQVVMLHLQASKPCLHAIAVIQFPQASMHQHDTLNTYTLCLLLQVQDAEAAMPGGRHSRMPGGVADSWPLAGWLGMGVAEAQRAHALKRDAGWQTALRGGGGEGQQEVGIARTDHEWQATILSASL